jgi:RNA polymerase sigma-70 factor (ECF subfamily)
MFSNRPSSPSVSEAGSLAQPASEPSGASEPSVSDAGDFEQIVRLHSSRVFNFIHQMTRQRQDTEDLVQQTFIKAYRNLHRFDASRPMINWLLTIARHTALNHFRSAKKWEELPQCAASSEPSPANCAQDIEDRENLWGDARRRLSQREFEILWLRYGEDLSVEETARVMGLSRAYTKIIAFRARQHLIKARAQ